MKSSHFKGKEALEHVFEARKKGHFATSEIHGEEIPGHYSAAADAAKETAILSLFLGTLFHIARVDAWMPFLIVFLIGYLFWKTGRSALLGYARLERLHRLIEEERWEIEHHRAQEKEELTALYAAKGFSGKLLDEVISVLMADNNRLLQVMLEEELGLNLHSYEHPFKQALGACVGVIGSALILSFGFFFFPFWGSYLAATLVIVLAAGTTAQLEKNAIFPSIIWNVTTAVLSFAAVYWSFQLIQMLL